MRIIKTPKGDIEIKNKWEDLSPEEYLCTIKEILRFNAGEIDYIELRLNLLHIYTGYKRSDQQLSQQEIEAIDYNLFILSETINFCFKPHYNNPELLETLSPELQKKLQTTFPFDCREANQQKELDTILPLLDYKAVPNLNCHKNLMPEIKLRDKIKGPHFEVDENGVCETDLLTEEYIDIVDYINVFSATNKREYLKKIAAILYRPNRKVYNTVECQKRADYYEMVPDYMLYAAFYIFMFIQEYFKTHPLFRVLFETTESENKKINKQGLISSLYQIAEAGYGSRNEVSQWNIIDFFNVSYKTLRDACHSLKEAKLNSAKISQKLKLPITTVVELLNS